MTPGALVGPLSGVVTLLFVGVCFYLLLTMGWKDEQPPRWLERAERRWRG